MKQKIEWHKMRDNEHPRNTLYRSILDFDGCDPNRKSYFLYFIIILITFIISVCLFVFLNINKLDLNRLQFPNDFRADLCGFKQLATKPLIYYRDAYNMGLVGFCVNQCPQQDQTTLCYYHNNGTFLLEDWCYQSYKSIAVGRFCVPYDHNNPNFDVIYQHIRSNRQWVRELIGSLHIQFNHLVYTVIIINIISLFTNCANFIRNSKLAIIITYIYNIIATILLIVGAILISLEKKTVQSHYCLNQTYNCVPNIQSNYDLAIVFLVILAIVNTLYGLLNYKNIKNESRCRVILYPLSIKSIVMTLIIQLIFNAFVLTLIYFYILNIAIGDIKTVNANKYFENSIYRAILYHYSDNSLFVLILVVSVILLNYLKVIGRMLVSGQVSIYFSTFSKQFLDKPLLRPLYYSLFKCSGQIIKAIILQILLFHLKYICWSVKSIFYKINEKSEQTSGEVKGDGWDDNKDSQTDRKDSQIGGKIIYVLFIICYPLIRVYEDYLKYINNYNYYNMVIFGDTYFRSGEKILYLRKRNKSRLQKLLPTINIQKNIMRVFLSSLSGLVFYISIQTSQLSNYFVDKEVYQQRDSLGNQYRNILILLAMFVNYYGQWIMCSILDETKETIYYIYCIDEEMFYGNQRRGTPFKPFFDGWGEEAQRISQGILKIQQIKVVEEKNLFQQVEEVLNYQPVVKQVTLQNIFEKIPSTYDTDQVEEKKVRKKQNLHQYNQQNIFDKVGDTEEEMAVQKKVVKKERMDSYNQNNIFDKVGDGPQEEVKQKKRVNRNQKKAQDFKNASIFEKQNDQIEQELSQFDQSSITSSISRREVKKQQQFVVKTNVFDQSMQEMDDEDDLLDDKQYRRIDSLKDYQNPNLFDKQSQGDSQSNETQSRVVRKKVNLEQFKNNNLFEKSQINEDNAEDQYQQKILKRNKQQLEQYKNPNLFEKQNEDDDDSLDSKQTRQQKNRKNQKKEDFDIKGIFDNEDIDVNDNQKLDDQKKVRNKKVEQLEQIKVDGIFEKNQDFDNQNETIQQQAKRKQEKLQQVKVDGIFEKKQDFDSESEATQQQVKRKQEKLQQVKVDGIFEKKQDFDDQSETTQQQVKRKQEKLQQIKVDGIFEKKQDFDDQSEKQDEQIKRKKEVLTQYNQQNIFDKESESSDENEGEQRNRHQPQLEQFDPPSIFDKDLSKQEKKDEKKKNKKTVQQEQFQPSSIFGGKVDNFLNL